MIIIGTKEEIEAMIKASCPHMVKHTVSCDQDCWACWNRSVSILIADPEKVGSKDSFLHSMTNLDNLVEEEGDEK